MVNTTKQRFHIPISFSIAIVAVAALATWLIVVMYTARVAEEADRPFAVADVARRPAVPTSFIGTVAALRDDSLVLAAEAAHNPHLSGDTVITVRLTPETAFSRSSLPARVDAEDARDLASLYRTARVSRTDLTAGSLVNVRTGSDVRGKREVAAESIEITIFTP